MNEQYGLSIEAACELFGHSARAYYYWRTHAKMTLSREKIIIEMARAIREQDPGIGSYKMWLMIRESYDPDWMPVKTFSIPLKEIRKKCLFLRLTNN